MMRRLTPGFLFCLFLAGCGGGGGGSTALPQAHVNEAPVTSPGAQPVTLSIAVPAPLSGASATRRRPLYVSVHTQSVAISVNGAAPVVADVAAGAPDCTAQTGGGRTCSVTVNAPVGTDTFAESTYASTNGTGAILSLNTISASVNAGKANVVNMTLDGVVASIALTLANPNPQVGIAATIGLVVNFNDASGAAIIGNDPFYNAVTLTNTDTSGASVLSTKLPLTSPASAAALSVAYNGANTPATFGATAAGVAAGSVTPATLTPQTAVVTSGFVDWPTYAYDSQRTGFNPSSTAITPASIAQLHLAWKITSNGGSNTQPIVATNIGSHKAIVIIGNFNGAEAFDALSGQLVWSRYLGTQNLQACGSNAPIAGTPAYDRSLGAVFMAGGDGGNPSHAILYRMDIGTGNVTGRVDMTPTLLPGEAIFAHTAVTFANGLMYAGVSSNCEGTSQGPPSWRGSVVAVNPASMAIANTFYPTYGQNGLNVGGGGVWAWGGVSADANGNVYVATGNAETPSSVGQPISAPFVSTDNEQFGYAEHLVKLDSTLNTVEDSNYPGFNFQVGCCDLDYAGTPVIYQPPIGSPCGILAATQGKGGTLVINDTQHLTPALGSFALSVPRADSTYIGNPAYSPNTGLLYAAITSAGAGSSMLPPGLAAISGCGSGMAWHAQFGPDSLIYTNGPKPRSAPTVTAGGVVFLGTPCTPDGNGNCGAAGSVVGGAVWAVDAAKGAVLGTNGKPLFIMPDTVRMAPTADGQWVYVLDESGNLYGLTVDPNVPKIAASGRRLPRSFRIPQH